MKHSNLSIKSYFDKVAAKTPTPGGGSSSAIFGVAGCALLEMVLNYSDKNKKAIKDASASLKKTRKRFLELIDIDIDVYNKLSHCFKQYGLASGKTQNTLKKAALPPLEVCAKSYDALCVAKRVVSAVNKNLISDVGCAVSGLVSAFRAAKFNVDVNINCIKNKKFASTAKKKILLLNKKVSTLEKDILKRINKII